MDAAEGGGGGGGGGRGCCDAVAALPSTSAVPMEGRERALTPMIAYKGEEDLPLPERPGFGSTGREGVVTTNHFHVGVENATIYQYDVSMNPEPKPGANKGKVLSELVKLHEEMTHGCKVLAYDGRRYLYTGCPLPFQYETFVITLIDEVEGRVREGREYKVTIQFAKMVDLHQLQDYLTRRRRNAHEDAIHAIDVVARASISNCLTAPGTLFSTKFGPIIDTCQGLEFWRGCYKSVHLLQNGPSLNIDIPVSPFYKDVLVVQFVSEFLGRTDSEKHLSCKESTKVERALKGVIVETTHQRDKPMKYKIRGLSAVPLKDLWLFMGDEEKYVTVTSYFQQRYSYKLKHIFWPCLECGRDLCKIYLPMEVCKIVQGQRYSRKLNTDQAAKLLKTTCERAQIRKQRIMRVRNNGTVDKFAAQFGISVDALPVNVPSHVLPTPTLKYHNSGKEKTCTPTSGQWNMINKKMVNGAEVKRWTCLNISNLPESTVQNFCSRLINKCNSMGMAFKTQPVMPFHSTVCGRIVCALENVHLKTSNLIDRRGKKLGKLQLLIVILPEDRGYYGKIKRVCEMRLGIVSQCCLPKHVKKETNMEYLENVALKINVKVGGRNTVLEQASVPSGIPFVSDVPTIIFGADVSHPSQGVCSPSIAAVVASMDWPEVTKYRATMSVQPCRQEIIGNLCASPQDLEAGIKNHGMIRELICSFKDKNSCLPERIIFYRDGISESQFSQVVLHEVDAIKKACLSIRADYLPPITFVVVQKRHRTRLFPCAPSSDKNETNGGILPGTVVDKSICHPWGFDFYLCSHATAKGTCRPTHYHVLFDESHFTADALQLLTNSLCYTYARCTRSVSIVPPVYYAHLAAARGRCYQGSFSDSSMASLSEGSTSSSTLPEGCQLMKINKDVTDVMFYC